MIWIGVVATLSKLAFGCGDHLSDVDYSAGLALG